MKYHRDNDFLHKCPILNRSNYENMKNSENKKYVLHDFSLSKKKP